MPTLLSSSIVRTKGAMTRGIDIREATTGPDTDLWSIMIDPNNIFNRADPFGLFRLHFRHQRVTSNIMVPQTRVFPFSILGSRTWDSIPVTFHQGGLSWDIVWEDKFIPYPTMTELLLVILLRVTMTTTVLIIGPNSAPFKIVPP